MCQNHLGWEIWQFNLDFGNAASWFIADIQACADMGLDKLGSGKNEKKRKSTTNTLQKN